MKTINGQKLMESFVSGANQLINNRERIDAMNVFPVPDGDTGSNMSGTIRHAVEETSNIKSEDIHYVASKFARGMLMGARGNSGVIFSQIFKGLSVSFADKKEVNSFELVNAFDCAREYAYKSVMKPVEGTILTVIRMTHEKLASSITPQSTIEQTFKIAAAAAKKACIETPKFLKVLKEVGVTDSGGEGLLMFLEGVNSYFEGKPVKLSEQESVLSSQQFLVNDDEEFSGEFGYCTEFITELKSPKSFKKDRFQIALEKMGDSIVVVSDDDILKTHIHAKKPGAVLSFAQKFGEFIKIKSENMTIQANESKKAKEGGFNNSTNNQIINDEEANIALISCNVGSGIIAEMQEMGANVIIEGGQSMNPSAKDFIEAIDSVSADKIVILPNNSNIVLTAQQVTQTSKKEIIIVPTKTQMQGLVAMMNYDKDGSLEDIQETLNDAINDVKTGQVTVSLRTTKINGVQVKKDEYLSISDRKIIGSSKSKVQAAIELCKKNINEDTEIATIFYGEDSTKTDAEEISSYIETHYDIEVDIKNGNQPTYNFLMSFE